MNSLKIPEGGVMLKGSPGQDSDPLPQQAFPISLSDSVIEGMIQCVQDGGSIQLALGAKPTFLYGSKTHRISSPPDDHACDLYLTQPYNSLREGIQIPAMSISRNPNKPSAKPRGPAASSGSSKANGSGDSSSASNLDSDVEALRKGMAAEDAKKERSVLLSGPLPTKKKGASKMNKLPWGNTGNNRSVSTSPALKPLASPSPNPTDPTQRAKQQRAPLVHQLAVCDQTTEHLRGKWEGNPEDFQTALEKVADYSPDSKTWTMRKSYWKELDVWNYDYDSGDREEAIKNAIKKYDNIRLSASEKEWDRLNPKDQRGKGICLSALQSKLAKGLAYSPAHPTIRVQKAEENSTSTSRDDGDVAPKDKQKLGGEAMTRSSSNPLPKTKKMTGSEAQAKRLLNPSKAKATTSKKASPTKGSSKSSKANGGRGPLSQEIIENSDSSGDEAVPLAKTKPVAKVAAKPAESAVKKLAERPVEKATPKPKPVARDPVPKPASKPAPKRRLEDDDSSSSSGTPLSQRIKTKQPLPAQPLKKRPLDAPRQAPREPAPSQTKNKNTSPTKSSPLASSPPTNASDMTDEEPPLAKKRKAEIEQKAPQAKRRAADGPVPAEVLSQAQKFKTFYSKYEALHHEISSLDNPPQDKLADLRDMRERLAHMKAQIYKKYRG